jgi:hypothetical protein
MLRVPASKWRGVLVTPSEPHGDKGLHIKVQRMSPTGTTQRPRQA